MVESKITPAQVLQIRNILRLLGFNQSAYGTKLINKAVQYIITNATEYFELSNLYKYLANVTPFTFNQIASLVTYATIHRNIQKSKHNFKKIFSYEYDDYIFTPKNIIEEIANIVK